ncbi:MAG: rhodanese-like domain-containing protein [Opitutales bacterium]
MKKFFVLFASCFAALAALAATDKYADISHADLKAALATGQATVLDVNGTESYTKGHIPGALDFDTVKAALVSKLPADKSALIVAYCGGPQCIAYREAYDAAVALGYTNVKHYRGGLSGWEQQGEKLEKK